MRDGKLVRRVAEALAGFACLSAGARADVIVVAQDGSGDFTQINQAIVQASDGDTLLARTGTYAPFIVPNRALEIVADEGASVSINGYAAVTGLAVGKSVLLSGLTTVAQLPSHFGLYLQNNAGHVRVRNCLFTGFTPPEQDCEDFGETDPGGDAVYVAGCDDVALVHCAIVGGDGGDSEYYWCLDTGGDGGRGIFASASSVSLYECSVIGGEGGTSGYSGSGGAGVHLMGSDLFASGRIIRGGDAGLTNDVIWICGDGGAGAFVDQNSVLRLRDVVLEGGKKGYPNGCDSSDGPDFSGTGILTIYPGAARDLIAARVVREGVAADLNFKGEPGDRVFLTRSDAAAQLHLPFLEGSWLLQPPLSMKAMGTIDASGTLAVSMPVSELPPGIEADLIHLQAVFTGAVDGKTLGSAVQLLVVDSAY